MDLGKPLSLVTSQTADLFRAYRATPTDLHRKTSQLADAPFEWLSKLRPQADTDMARVSTPLIVIWIILLPDRDCPLKNLRFRIDSVNRVVDGGIKPYGFIAKGFW